MKKILCIVETAYRATQEEQDDAALWLAHSVRRAGGELGIVLRGNAVSYAVAGQDPTGITIGSTSIARPPRPDEDLLKMRKEGIAVHVVKEDVEIRAIPRERLVAEFELIEAARLPELFSRYDQIWHW